MQRFAAENATTLQNLPRPALLDEKDMAAPATRDGREALRDDEGAIRPEFVATVSEAIAGRDAGLFGRW